MKILRNVSRMSKGNRPLYGKQVSIEPCHECGTNMRFELDMDLNGNHVLNCPKCGHEHCRVVRDGKVTGDRWDSRNPVRVLTSATAYYGTVSQSATTGGYILRNAWLDSTTGS